MGQYYKAAILGEDRKTVEKWFYSWDYECGLKLMEHSWMKNPYVQAVEKSIFQKPTHLVWAGDYADEDDDGLNVYDRCEEPKQSHVVDTSDFYFMSYIVNHTKKCYVNKINVSESEDGWRIHPLPLLTCEGNGRGGGDYRGASDLIGTWARDLISVEETMKGFEDYEEVVFDLVEA
jgi:hypothetical protein